MSTFKFDQPNQFRVSPLFTSPLERIHQIWQALQEMGNLKENARAPRIFHDSKNIIAKE